MKIKFLKTLWGIEDMPVLEEQLKRVAEAGYDGFEAPPSPIEPDAWCELLDKYGLIYAGMVSADDVKSFAAQLEKIQVYRPVVVNSQSGLDRMSFQQGCDFFLEALKVEKDVGIPVAHETHRHRLFYAPWCTIPYLEEFPDLKLCADFSHWCVVAESLLEKDRDLMSIACERTIHIHARVGYEQGPQVSDPRAPEYAAHLEQHQSWWDMVVDTQQGGGAAMLTVTPEYRPSPYLHTLPYTRQPVADPWEISLWTANRLRERWGKRAP
jgi:sugar phosphate isomerase/epimerase